MEDRDDYDDLEQAAVERYRWQIGRAAWEAEQLEAETQAAVHWLEAAGLPLSLIQLKDRYESGELREEL